MPYALNLWSRDVRVSFSVLFFLIMKFLKFSKLMLKISSKFSAIASTWHNHENNISITWQDNKFLAVLAKILVLSKYFNSLLYLYLYICRLSDISPRFGVTF